MGDMYWVQEEKKMDKLQIRHCVFEEKGGFISEHNNLQRNIFNCKK